MSVIARFHDYIHEMRIQRAFRAVVRAKSIDEARMHAERMCWLVRARSAEQVARMDRARGLV